MHSEEMALETADWLSPSGEEDKMREEWRAFI